MTREPRVWVFFYGSYINLDVLAEVQLVPQQLEVARLPGFDIVIEPRANLVRSDQHTVYGVLCTATHAELERLYVQHAHGVLGERYLPEAVLVQTLDGRLCPAMTYICHEMRSRPAETDYVQRIARPARAFGFPDWYLSKLQAFLPREIQ